MMSSGEMHTVTRNIDGVLIPMGTPVVIPEGAMVRITQELGDAITIAVHGNLVRIERRDADALGLETEPERCPPTERAETADGPVDEEAVWDALRQCYDPEIPVNIVDLGLVYGVRIEGADAPDAQGEGQSVEVRMTLTAPGCGMGPFLVEDVRKRVLDVAGVRDVRIELVFDPPWDRSMMSDLARLKLGMF